MHSIKPKLCDKGLYSIDVEILRSSLNCMQTITKNCSSLSSDCIEIIYSQATLIFIEILVNCTLENSSSIVLSNIELVSLFAANIRAVTQHLNEKLASDIMDIIMKLFFSDDRKIDHEVIKFNSLDSFKPLQVSSSHKQTQLILIAEAVLGCMNCKTIRETFSSKSSEFINKLLTMACNCNDNYSRESAARCLSAVMNKLDRNKDTEDLMNSILLALTIILDGNEKLKKIYAIKVWSWLCKSAVMASHPSMIQLTDKLIQLLGDPELGEFASEGFSIIVKDSDKVLNSSSQGVIMFMFKQRFFIETSQLLLDGFNSSPEYLKTNFLMALSHQLEFLPNQVLLSETNKLVPVLVQSLSIHNTSVINSSLQTIVLFMDRNPEAFSSHLQSLTCQLLKLSEYKENLTIRKSALACLKSIAKQPDYLLLPLKSNVISSLTKRLDDHKRLVRQAAADARCEWFLVGAPGN
ncbi:MMS19 nucleotide excision repair [Nymphon striatum]|nr:MMS19 nucleotide excision repair [Nymphon striatum]